jgi:hypothetical protein
MMTMVRTSVHHYRLRHPVFTTCPEKSRVSRMGTSKNYSRFLSCYLFGPVNHGQKWTGLERSGKKAWLSDIIKRKLSWLSRSMTLPVGTFPWLSLLVILVKANLKGLILRILSTYQPIKVGDSEPYYWSSGGVVIYSDLPFFLAVVLY